MADDLDSRWDKMLFGVRRSIRYHLLRKRFFDRLGQWAKFLVIASGGTVIAVSKTNESEWQVMIGLVVAILGAFDLVADFSGSAREHHDLVKEFSELERKMVSASANQTEEDYSRFANERSIIEDEEPPTMRILDVYCHNELVRAEGHDEGQMCKLTLLQTFLKQWVDWFPSRVKKCGIKPASET